MLLLEWQCKAVDDAAQYLQQLSNAVVVLRLKDEPVEHVVDSLAHKRPGEAGKEGGGATDKAV